MKKYWMSLVVVFLAAVALLGSVRAEAAPLSVESGTCGSGVNWTLDTETGLLTISGSGAMANYNVPGS